MLLIFHYISIWQNFASQQSDLTLKNQIFPDLISQNQHFSEKSDLAPLFLRLVASIHRPSLNQRSTYSLQKFEIRILRMFLPLEASFPEKFFTWVPPPLLCSSSKKLNPYAYSQRCQLLKTCLPARRLELLDC
jgi:hypothetical protein